ncbi:protein translocase subunit SecF [Altericista sp. CCNU0014]|uniref:protein translocase subunit SecF n=1 Tax=Altericista sp. CCNU0014 TaxID=3082949 RepID=UPI00384FA9E3
MKLVLSKQRSLWWTVSVAVILAGIASMIISYIQFGAPLRPSLDFVGGTRLQFERNCQDANACRTPIDTAAVREVLAEQGLGDSSIQVLGEKQQAISVRTKTLGFEQRGKVEAALNQKIGPFDIKKSQIDTVGPTLGRQLLTSGLLALLVSFSGIALYLSIRYQLDYAFWGIVALFHDILITVGIFSILGLLLGIEADSLFIVALLTITGFSINDTVVIYDRVRENIKPGESISETVDIAVNQTLGRSINTTLTVLLPLVAIFVFGGATLKYFALALIIGFLAGAYSSIFIASTLLVWWRESTQAKVSPEAAALDTASIDLGDRPAPPDPSSNS